MQDLELFQLFFAKHIFSQIHSYRLCSIIFEIFYNRKKIGALKRSFLLINRESQKKKLFEKYKILFLI